MPDASEPGGAKERQYYALVSSAPGGRDARWARWIQRRLENYRIPSDLIMTPREGGGAGEGPDNLPSRFTVASSEKCRKKAPPPGSGSPPPDGAGSISDAAHYLIVVCSPRGAASPETEKDAFDFASHGRGAGVIPFIIEGEPLGAAGGPGCYPPSISPDILGVSLADADKEAALARIIARLLKVKFSRIYERHLRERRSALYRFLAGALLALALMIVLAFTAVSKQREASERRAEARLLLEFIDEKILAEPRLPAEAQREAGLVSAGGAAPSGQRGLAP